MSQIPWRSGKLLVWDVTVVSTTAESYVAAAARGRGEVAEMALFLLFLTPGIYTTRGKNLKKIIIQELITRTWFKNRI